MQGRNTNTNLNLWTECLGVWHNNKAQYLLVWPPQLFVASVLLEPELALTPMPSPAHHGYGAMASSQGPSHGPVEEEEGEEDHAQTHETELQDPPDTYRSSPLMDSPVGYQ